MGTNLVYRFDSLYVLQGSFAGTGGDRVHLLVVCTAERGLCGPGDPAELVRRRLEHLNSGTPHVSERRREDGRVVELGCALVQREPPHLAEGPVVHAAEQHRGVGQLRVAVGDVDVAEVAARGE